MTLKATMQADVLGVLINTDEHADSVTYRPKGGAARTISVVIDEDGTYESGEGLKDRDVFEVFAYRDPDSGIDDPQPGDEIDVTRNGRKITMFFEGTVSGADQFGWFLRYHVSTFKRAGSNTR